LYVEDFEIDTTSITDFLINDLGIGTLPAKKLGLNTDRILICKYTPLSTNINEKRYILRIVIPHKTKIVGEAGKRIYTFPAVAPTVKTILITKNVFDAIKLNLALFCLSLYGEIKAIHIYTQSELPISAVSFLKNAVEVQEIKPDLLKGKVKAEELKKYIKEVVNG